MEIGHGRYGGLFDYSEYLSNKLILRVQLC